MSPASAIQSRCVCTSGRSALVLSRSNSQKNPMKRRRNLKYSNIPPRDPRIAQIFPILRLHLRSNSFASRRSSRSFLPPHLSVKARASSASLAPGSDTRRRMLRDSNCTSEDTCTRRCRAARQLQLVTFRRCKQLTIDPTHLRSPSRPLSLPSELLSLVLSSLADILPDDYDGWRILNGTLAAVSRVSKDWSEAAYRELYEDLCLEWVGDGGRPSSPRSRPTRGSIRECGKSQPIS